MNILNDTIYLCAPTLRSRAYAQIMHNADIFPGTVLYLPGEEPDWNGDSEINISLGSDGDIVFYPDVTVKNHFNHEGINEHFLPNSDINSEECINYLRSYSEKIVIYSGYGGVILRSPLFDLDKKFLHIHGGYAPSYRGSTAFYYSILDDRSVAATALWLEQDIDAGPIIARKKIGLDTKYDIDYIIDPLLRASLLRDILQKRVEDGFYPEGEHDNENSFTYFVIHPLLKHIAMRQCNLIE